MGKILYVATPPYDMDPFSYNVQGIGLGKAFCRLGYDFDCIRFKKDDQKQWTFYEFNGHQMNYIEKGRIRFFRWGICPELCRPEYLDRYDYIIVREYYQIMAYLLSRGRKNVFLYSGHYYNPFMLPFTSPIYDSLITKRLNQQVGAKFVKSPLAKTFLEEKGYDNVINVGVGLDVERFDDDVLISDSTREIVDYMSRNECLLFVGNISEVKNYPFLLEVFEGVKKRKPNLKLMVIGRSMQSARNKLLGKKDGSYAPEVESRFTHDVVDSIIHIERVENSQLRFIYPLAKALLLPSKSEIFGMVMLEAMYLGAPVVTTRHGGSTAISSDGRAGIVIPSFDRELWIDAVIRLLEEPKYSQEMVEEARRRVEESFTWDAIANTMLGEMVRLCPEGGARR